MVHRHTVAHQRRCTWTSARIRSTCGFIILRLYCAVLQHHKPWAATSSRSVPSISDLNPLEDRSSNRGRVISWFVAQIRNTASLGGNIVTGSPISDLNPLWMCARATFATAGQGTKPRTLPARTFFLGYRCAHLLC